MRSGEWKGVNWIDAKLYLADYLTKWNVTMAQQLNNMMKTDIWEKLCKMTGRFVEDNWKGV